MTFDPDKMRRLLLGSSDEDSESEEKKKSAPEAPIAGESDTEKAPDKTPPEKSEPQLKPEIFSEAKSTVIHTPSERDIETVKPPVKSIDQTIKKIEFGREDRSPDRKPFEKSEPVRIERKIPDIIERKIPDIKETSHQPVPPPTPFIAHTEKKESAAGFDKKSPDEISHEPPESATIETFAPLRNSLISDEKKPEAHPEKKSEKKAETTAVNKNKSAKIPGKNVKESKPKRKSLKPVSPPGPLSLLVLIGGGIAFIGALVTVVMGRGGSESFSLTGIGIALAGAFVLVNRRWIRQSLSTRSARYSANISIAILSLLGILICINFITYRLHYRWDVSAEGLFTLSPQTLKVLSDIDRAGEEVSVIAFAPSGNNFRDDIENLIDKYQYESKNIKFKFVDPDVERELTESKGIDRIPSVLFELGDNSSTVVDIDESHFTSALMAVRESRTRIVEFLTGHGEPDPFADSKSDLGLGAFREKLELDRYEVKLLSIPESDGVPQDTSLLIIVAPERNLEPAEIDAIGKYLDSGGNLMCFLEPGKDSGLSDLLAEYGISPVNGIVLDDKRNAYGELTSPIVVPNPDNPITKSLTEGLEFLNAGPLDYTTASRLPGVETESLVRSDASSWVEKTDVFAFDEDFDKRESVEMAILATRTIAGTASSTVETEGGLTGKSATSETGSGEKSADGSPDKSQTKDDGDSQKNEAKVARVLVVNDSSFIRNANIEKYFNRDFALNSVNWLTSARVSSQYVRGSEKSEALICHRFKNRSFSRSVSFSHRL